MATLNSFNKHFEKNIIYGQNLVQGGQRKSQFNVCIVKRWTGKYTGCEGYSRFFQDLYNRSLSNLRANINQTFVNTLDKKNLPPPPKQFCIASEKDPTNGKPLGRDRNFFLECVLHIKIAMSTNFQMIMLMLGTDYIGREQPSHPVQCTVYSVQVHRRTGHYLIQHTPSSLPSPKSSLPLLPSFSSTKKHILCAKNGYLSSVPLMVG